MIDGLQKLSSAAARPEPPARIHVDQDGSGRFVYRLVDVATGRVLVELPRDRAGELKTSLGHALDVRVPTRPEPDPNSRLRLTLRSPLRG